MYYILIEKKNFLGSSKIKFIQGYNKSHNTHVVGNYGIHRNNLTSH